MIKRKTNYGTLSLVLGIFMLISCKSMNNTQKGAAVGAGTGAALGAVLGNRTGQTGRGAALGSVIGGATGAVIGVYMDKQAEKMEKIENAEVERVGEAIKVTFESGILFGFDSDALTPQSQETIMKFAEILNEYPDTHISIEGHTDNRGTQEYNQRLSQRRADAVKNYLKMQKVDETRMMTLGQSFNRPIASNDTDEGRTKNRRVEMYITANEDLIEKAESGKIENN
jgi:outer membrane protein OmpA-like peptidoglycan-associated protein